MKKLKKGLSLLLVLTMVLGLMTSAFATSIDDFTDKDKITQTEAVGTMTGMGIINGTDTGAFDPTGDFTREQAAKIIAYMLLGKDLAEQQKSVITSDPFTDVKADRWSAGYIAYCVSEKILAGDGTGNFNPEQKLTKGAWLKMLLVAAGVDPEKAGLVNNAMWETKALTYAVNGYEDFSPFSHFELDGFITVDESNLTFDREVAALYAFNLLKPATAEYYNGYSPIGEKQYNLTAGTATDELGHESSTWTNGGTTTYYSTPDTLVGTFTTKITAADIDKVTGKADALTKIIVDGAQNEANSDATLVAVSNQGTLTEIYQKADKSFYAVVTETYVAKITAITPATASTAASTLLESGLSCDATNLKVGDVVSYNKGISTKDKTTVVALNVTKITGTEGTITATATGYVKVDGAKKVAAVGAMKDTNVALNVTADLTVGATGVFYYDTYGNILYVGNVITDPVTRDIDGYAYIIATKATAGTAAKPAVDAFSDPTPATPATAKAQIIDLATDTVTTVNLGIVETENGWFYADKFGDATASPVAQSTNLAVVAGIYGYYKLADGTYVLDTVNKATTVTLAAGKASIGSDPSYATSATKLTVVTGTKTGTTYTAVTSTSTVTGIKNFTAMTDAPALVLTDGNKVTEIVAFQVAASAPVQSDEIYAVYLRDGETTTAGTEHYFYVDGAEECIVGKEISLDGATKNDIVKIVKNSDGTLKTVTKVTGTVGGDVTASDTTFVIAGGNTYYFAEGCMIYDATTAQKGFTTDTTATIVKDADDNAVVIVIEDVVD